MKKILYKFLCFIGWHSWTYSYYDHVAEFGSEPFSITRIPKNARCSRCNIFFSEDIN